MTLSLAASENVGGLHAAIADRLAAEDDARREWLNATKRKYTPRLVRVAESKLFDAAEATVEQLVETIETCKAELLTRQEQLGNQLNSISKALGEAA